MRIFSFFVVCPSSGAHEYSFFCRVCVVGTVYGTFPNSREQRKSGKHKTFAEDVIKSRDCYHVETTIRPRLGSNLGIPSLHLRSQRDTQRTPFRSGSSQAGGAKMANIKLLQKTALNPEIATTSRPLLGRALGAISGFQTYICVHSVIRSGPHSGLDHRRQGEQK